MDSGTMPHRPGMSGRSVSSGATIMSQVEVPMFLTSMPGLMPEPTPPRWASNAPTETGMPAGRPVRSAHSALNVPGGFADVES